MKGKLIISMCVLAALASCAGYGNRNYGSNDSGTYTYTNSAGQLMECTRQSGGTTTSGGHPVLGTLAGAAVGGVVGNQFGKGSGKTAMTAAGVVGGAVIGNRMSQGTTEQQSSGEENCHPVNR